jgi:hypothetical protein
VRDGTSVFQTYAAPFYNFKALFMFLNNIFLSSMYQASFNGKPVCYCKEGKVAKINVAEERKQQRVELLN